MSAERNSDVTFFHTSNLGYFHMNRKFLLTRSDSTVPPSFLVNPSFLKTWLHLFRADFQSSHVASPLRREKVQLKSPKVWRSISMNSTR
jgi:hypothetical protein